MAEEEYCNDPICERVRRGEKHPKHDLTQTWEKRSQSLGNLIKKGFKISGATIGAGLGFVFGGPQGAIIGAGFGSAIEAIGEEIGNRQLAKREQERVGFAVILTCDKIKENIEKGMRYRDDDFFREKPNDRSTAKEVTEGILLAAQREYQEKKIVFYSNLLANIAFYPEIDRAQANLLIRLAESLSYRQLCILALFAQKNKFKLRQHDYQDNKTIDIKTSSLLQEIFELYTRHMLYASGIALLGLGDINPSNMTVQGTGTVLAQLMELLKIDTTDLNEIALLLQ